MIGIDEDIFEFKSFKLRQKITIIRFLKLSTSYFRRGHLQSTGKYLCRILFFSEVPGDCF